MNLPGKVVLITGGSRGLGLQLAREFGARGATVVIASRDAEELDRARRDLVGRGISAHTAVCDISDQQQSDSLIREATQKVGAIDVLVNNAGLIQVGPADQMTVTDFQNAMDVMFWGMLYPTLAALPGMRERGEGRIVNITSIGGKISVPHLLPYCCAKSAAVALSEGLRAELKSSGILVTTIVPGLMRTGSHLQAQFKGDRAKEYAWFSMGASNPLVSISAGRAAKSIVNATVRGDAERILSVPADLAARVHGIAPELTSVVASWVHGVLPKANGGTTGLAKGAEARAELNSLIVNRILSAANFLGEQAAEALNQRA